MAGGLDFWQDLVQSNAVWRFMGIPTAPHVKTRSGLHSDGYVDTLSYLSSSTDLRMVASTMAREFLSPVISERIDWVIGSPMAGVPLATMVGMEIGARRVGFTEKLGDKDLICRFDMEPGSTVLHIEEMSTTGGTPQRGIDAVLKKNPEVTIIPWVGAFLIRCAPNPPELTSAQFMPIINLPELGVVFHEWKPEDCPLCAMGSRVITNPKKVWSDFLRTMENPRHVIPGAEYLV